MRPWMLLASLVPAAAISQPTTSTSPFNGAWIMDLEAGNDASEPVVMSLRQGVFARGDSSSSVTVRADGRFHPISDGNYVDQIAVTVKNGSYIREINRFKGRTVYSLSYVISPDGNTMLNEIVDYSKPDQNAVATRIRYKRLGKRRTGDFPVTGRWSRVKVETSRDHLTSTFKVSVGRFSASDVGGSGFDAIIGGPPVPIRGDAEAARIAIMMPDDRTIIEQMSINGKPTVTVTMSLLPGDRTIKATGRRAGATSDFSWIMRKED